MSIHRRTSYHIVRRSNQKSFSPSGQASTYWALPIWALFYQGRALGMGEPRTDIGHYSMPLLLPGDADRVVQPEFIEHADQFGSGAGEADQTERGQHGVPQDQQTLEPEAGAVTHQPPEPEHQDGVHGGVVKPAGPVLDHPLSRRLVAEVFLEIEHVRVVGRFRVHHDADHGCYHGAVREVSDDGRKGVG